MKNFTLFWPDYINAFLTKDVGIIPAIMQNNYGYKSSVLTMKNDREYPDNEKYNLNLKIDFYETEKDISKYLENTDILMLIGIYSFNLDIIENYKRIKPEGKIYMKLDANIHWMTRLNESMNKEILSTLNKVDLISVESRSLQYYINATWDLAVEYIPNGYYDFVEDEEIKYEDKENIIIFAGRVGTPEKANHILLEAFRNVQSEIKGWKLELVGNIDGTFLPYLQQYMSADSIKDKIIIKGQLDKAFLKEEYKKAKIFCLTSPCESCANVFSESISNGCYLISSNVDGAMDIMDYGRYGRVFPVNDIKALGDLLIRICNNEELLRENCERAQIYAKENLKWVNLCKIIDDKLK